MPTYASPAAPASHAEESAFLTSAIRSARHQTGTRPWQSTPPRAVREMDGTIRDKTGLARRSGGPQWPTQGRDTFFVGATPETAQPRERPAMREDAAKHQGQQQWGPFARVKQHPDPPP